MGVRGLKGDLRVMSLTDAPERLAAGQRVIVEGETAPREILEAGIAKHGPVLRLKGIADRDAAAALIGKHLIGQHPIHGRRLDNRGIDVRVQPGSGSRDV